MILRKVCVDGRGGEGLMLLWGGEWGGNTKEYSRASSKA